MWSTKLDCFKADWGLRARSSWSKKVLRDSQTLTEYNKFNFLRTTYGKHSAMFWRLSRESFLIAELNKPTKTELGLTVMNGGGSTPFSRTVELRY